MVKNKNENAPVKKSEIGSSAEAWNPFSALRGEFDQLLDRFSRDWPIGDPLGGMSFPTPMRRMQEAWGFGVPAVDFIDKEDAVEVRAELPGMSEEDIDVEVTDSILTISGEKKEEREEGEKGGRYYLSERKYGSFERSIHLPDGVDKDKVAAIVKDGVLVVTIAKTPEARKKPKKSRSKAPDTKIPKPGSDQLDHRVPRIGAARLPS